MSDNLFITATEARSGKSAISLGVMEMLLRKIKNVGFFRPIINIDPNSNRKDDDINLISSHFDLKIPYDKMYGFTGAEASNLVSLGRDAEIIEGIIKKCLNNESCECIIVPNPNITQPETPSLNEIQGKKPSVTTELIKGLSSTAPNRKHCQVSRMSAKFNTIKTNVNPIATLAFVSGAILLSPRFSLNY